MKEEIREIMQYILDHPEMTTRAAVDSYFDQILWSIEKQEWMSLTEHEKQQFVNKLDTAKSTRPKEA